MLPARRFNQFGLTDFFNDLFENRSLDKVGVNTPAINVIETDKEYKLELAAPGMCKDDFQIHINKEGNLVIEMEKKSCGCKGTQKIGTSKFFAYFFSLFCYFTSIFLISSSG